MFIRASFWQCALIFYCGFCPCPCDGSCALLSNVWNLEIFKGNIEEMMRRREHWEILLHLLFTHENGWHSICICFCWDLQVSKHWWLWQISQSRVFLKTQAYSLIILTLVMVWDFSKRNHMCEWKNWPQRKEKLVRVKVAIENMN